MSTLMSRFVGHTMRFLAYNVVVNVALMRLKHRCSKRPHVYVYVYVNFNGKAVVCKRKKGKWTEGSKQSNSLGLTNSDAEKNSCLLRYYRQTFCETRVGKC